MRDANHRWYNIFSLYYIDTTDTKCKGFEEKERQKQNITVTESRVTTKEEKSQQNKDKQIKNVILNRSEDSNYDYMEKFSTQRTLESTTH